MSGGGVDGNGPNGALGWAAGEELVDIAPIPRLSAGAGLGMARTAVTERLLNGSCVASRRATLTGLAGPLRSLCHRLQHAASSQSKIGRA